MPTTRPRITITETDDVARMLDAAAKRWPEARGSRSELLRRLAEQGEAALRAEREDWQARVRRTAGAGRGAYPPGYLDALREDWPE